MAAYYCSVVGQCSWFGCYKRGDYEVRNACNARVGAFCAKHAKQRVAELNRQSEALTK